MTAALERDVILSVLDAVAAGLEVGLPAACVESEEAEPGLYLPPPRDVLVTGSRIAADDTPRAGAPECYVMQSRSSVYTRNGASPSNVRKTLELYVEVRLNFLHAPQPTYQLSNGRWVRRDSEHLARREHSYAGALKSVLRCVCGVANIQKVEIVGDHAQQIAPQGAQTLFGTATVVAAFTVPTRIKSCGG